MSRLIHVRPPRSSRRDPLLRSVVLAGLVAISFARAQTSVSPSFAEASVHDPSIVRDGESYYVFGSHLAAARSDDLVNWTQIATSAAPGNALVPNPAVEFAEALSWARTSTFWAPDVIRLGDGRYYYYYCACQGDAPRSALGVAVADSITGPYRNLGLMLKSGMWGEPSHDGRVYDATVHPNVVDPAVFFDADERLWMVYGSYSGGIFILRLDPSNGFPLPGQGYGKKLIGGNHARIEAPYIVRSPETGFYYLFVSYGGLGASDGYNVRVGRSRHPDGPYVDAAGAEFEKVAGAPGTLFDDASIAPYGVKLIGNYQFGSVAGESYGATRGYRSPGHNSVYRDPTTGDYFLVFHTRFANRGEQHEVRVHRMFLNRAGWFVVAPHRYGREALRPTVDAQVRGEYKLIQHGRAISGTIMASEVIQLHEDGSISGATSGSWRLEGEHEAVLRLAERDYTGVFIRQWDDDQKLWVMAFTALSSDGLAVWGSKVAKPRPAAVPVILAQPSGRAVRRGAALKLAVVAEGSPEPMYQWRRDGIAIPGANASVYDVAAAQANDAGQYTVEITNSQGTVTSAPAELNVVELPNQVQVPPSRGSARIVNLATRGIVAQGENALIAGFVVSGTTPKPLLLRAAGNHLTQFGISEAIGRPLMTLYHHLPSGNVPLATNRDWAQNAAAIRALADSVGAQQYAVSTDPSRGDAALAVTLPEGAYSVVVVPDPSSRNQDGVGMVEIFDAAPTSSSKLLNISSRGRVESGERQMILGVVVAGEGAVRTMIRGVGPALQPAGLRQFLRRPQQVLFRSEGGQNTALSENDDWWNSPQADQLRSLFPPVGAFALPDDSSDSAVLVSLPAGNYSSVISSADGQAGVAIAEVYDTGVH